MSHPTRTGTALFSLWFLTTALASGQEAGAGDDSLPQGVIRRIGSDGFHVKSATVSSKIRFSPDGKHIASFTTKTVQLSEAATGKLLWSTATDQNISQMKFNKDGKKLAILNLKKYIVLATETGKPILDADRLSSLGNIPPLYWAIAPDLQTLACIDGYDFKLYNAETGKELNTIKFREKSDERVPKLIEFTGDGKSIYVYMGQPIALGNGKKLQIKSIPKKDVVLKYDAVSGKQLQTIQFPFESTTAKLIIAPNDKMLAVIIQTTESGGKLRKNHLVLWDLDAGKPKHVLENLLPVVICADFSPDGSALALGGSRSSGGSLTELPPDSPDIVILDTHTGKTKALLPWRPLKQSPVPPSIRALSFSPDGKKLASFGSGTGLAIWDAETGKPVTPFFEPTGVRQVRYFTAGKEILTVGDQILWWDAASGKRLHETPGIKATQVSVVSPDGKWIVITVFNPNEVGKLETFLVDAATGKKTHAFGQDNKRPTGAIFSPDSKKLLSTVSVPDPRIVIWDVASGQPLLELKDDPGIGNVLAISTDGRWLASGVHSTNVVKEFDLIIWDLASVKSVRRMSTKSVNAMAFTPDSARLITIGSSSKESRLLLWDIAAGKLERTFIGPASAAGGVAINPDSRMFATSSASDKTVRLWELASGQERAKITGHKTFVFSLDFSPDGKTLVAASDDAPVYLWDVYGLEKPKSPRASLSKAVGAKFWQQLADGSAAVAFKSMCELISHGSASVSILKEQWQQMPRTPPKELQKWLAELGSDEFSARQAASKELERIAAQFEAVLREALQKQVSLETRRRLEKILDQTEPQRLRVGRMLEVLETIGTPEARLFLRALADQKNDAGLAAAAEAGLSRLTVSLRE